MDTQKRAPIFILWILVSTIGSTLGLTLGSVAGEQIGFPLGYLAEEAVQRAIPLLPTGLLSSMIAGLFYGSVTGFVPGILQWLFVLRKLPGGSMLWIFLNLAGIGVAFSLNSGVFMLLIGFGLDSVLWSLVSTGISGVVTGSLLGILHWLYFRRRYNKALWWIIFDLAGWIATDFLFTVFLYLNILAFEVLEILANGVNAFLLAICTGIALYLVLSESHGSAVSIPGEG